MHFSNSDRKAEIHKVIPVLSLQIFSTSEGNRQLCIHLPFHRQPLLNVCSICCEFYNSLLY